MEELKSLVIRARSGDLEAFGEIVRRFQDMTHGYAYSLLGDFHLAEDVAQEAFLDVYRQLPNLRNPKAFSSWFRRIVFKHCDRITRGKHIQTVSINVAATTITEEDAGTVQSIEEYETREEVLEAIRALPEHERMVTTLFYINGYSQKEIGEFLEVPVTTVKKRLYNSRKKLKERMKDMVNSTLRENALPEDFAQRLLRFPFPKREPKVEIIDCPGESLEVCCIDAQPFFIPMVEDGKCDWTFYDWPSRLLTGIYECHVISTAKWGQGTLLRIWIRHTNFEKDSKQEWEERHLLVENDTYRWVKLERDKPGKSHLSSYIWANGEASEPEPMKLKTGLKWDKPATEVIGVSKITIAGKSWKCLKVAGISPDSKTYVEWYVAETGRTVFFRRYNAPGWRERESERPGGYESLAGQLEAKYRGTTFRHWYDCIPDIVLEKRLNKN